MRDFIMKRPLLILGFLGVVIILLSVLQVVVSNSISTTGMSLGKIQDEVETYQRENTLLSERVLTLASYDHIASVAATEGFVPSGTPVAVSNSLPLAINR